MFRILLPLLISFSLFAQSIALSDLAFIVQKKDNVTIVFGRDVSKTLLVDFPSDYSNSSYMPFFKTVLMANNLTLIDNGGIFIVSAVTSHTPSIPITSPNGSLLAPPPLLNQNHNNDLPLSVPSAPLSSASSSSFKNVDFNSTFVSHKLDFLQFDDVKSLLEFSGVPFSFSPISKTLTFNENKKNKKYIQRVIEQIKNIDVQKDQVTLKITMFTTNNDKLREVGLNPSLKFDFSLLSKTGALLTGDYASSFKSSLAFLSTAGVSDVTQSTSYLISDNEKLDFQKIVSIPVKDENFALTTNNGTNQSTKYKYEDVGFKVLATPTIVGDTVYLDFMLSIGDVIVSGDLPTTSKNSISNKFCVKKGDIIFLSGLTKDTNKEDKVGLPFLEYIPFLNDIFTQKKTHNIKETFNISIEILN